VFASKILVFLCVTLILDSPLQAEQSSNQSAGKLSGIIRSGQEALAKNVTIILKDSEGRPHDMTVSDTDGKFEFPRVAAGEYQLATFSTVFAPSQQIVTIKPKQQVKLNILVNPEVEASPVVSSPQIRVPENTQSRILVRPVKAIYPERAKQRRSQGAVTLEMIISVTGSVVAARVVNTEIDPDLAKAAVDAVKQWQYKPTLVNGNVVEVRTSTTVFFGITVQPPSP